VKKRKGTLMKNCKPHELDHVGHEGNTTILRCRKCGQMFRSVPFKDFEKEFLDMIGVKRKKKRAKKKDINLAKYLNKSAKGKRPKYNIADMYLEGSRVYRAQT